MDLDRKRGLLGVCLEDGTERYGIRKESWPNVDYLKAKDACQECRIIPSCLLEAGFQGL